MAYQIFLSPLVKRCALITYKQHGIYDLFHELPNDLKKLGNVKKLPKLHRMIDPRPSLPPSQIESPVNTRRKLLKNRN